MPFRTGDTWGSLAAERFGRERAGVVFGWVFAGHQLGAGTAALGAGWLRTDALTYMPALYIASTMCVVAALSVLLLSKGGMVPQPT